MSTLDAGQLAGAGNVPRASSYLSVAGGALLVFAAYYLGAKLGLALTFRPHPISVLWPPNAILLAALLLAPIRWWPVLVAAAFPAHLLAELQDGVPAAMVLCWFVSNVSEALIGAFCVRWLLRGPLTFDSLPNVSVFIAFARVARAVSLFISRRRVRDVDRVGRRRLLAAVADAVLLQHPRNLTIVPVIVTWASVGTCIDEHAVPGGLWKAWSSLRAAGGGRLRVRLAPAGAGRLARAALPAAAVPAVGGSSLRPGRDRAPRSWPSRCW